MGTPAMVVSVGVFVGVGYLYLRSYWAGYRGLNGELFD